MATGAVIGQEPYWEPAQDMLGGVDLNSWRTPGINPSAEIGEDNHDKKEGFVLYGGIFDQSAEPISQEEYDAAKKQNPLLIAIGERFGLLRPAAKAKDGKGVGNIFTRAAFVLIGLVFITVSLVMISRPAQEGIVEGIREGLES